MYVAPAASTERTQTDKLNKSLLEAFLRRIDDGSAPSYPEPADDGSFAEVEEEEEEEPLSLEAPGDAIEGMVMGTVGFASDTDMEALLAEHKGAVEEMKQANRAKVEKI